MANILINYKLTRQNSNNNNITEQNNENSKNKRNINRNLPKLNLDHINETNFGQNKTRKNIRNKTTMVLNTNFKNRISSIQQKIEEKDKEKEQIIEEEKKIHNTVVINKEKIGKTKTNLKNFFSKSDFMYFN